MRCVFSWQASWEPLHNFCLHSECVSAYTFNWLIKLHWSELSWYSDTAQATEAPVPLLVTRARSKTLEMQNVPDAFGPIQLTAYWEEIKRNWALCPPPHFDNNKEADGPATKGNVNVHMSDANKAITKLRTSIWAWLSNCTLFFTWNFREDWTFMHLISIMDLILPSASEVSRRLCLVDNSRCDRSLGRTPACWRGSEEAWRVGPRWRSYHLCGLRTCEHFLSLYTVIKFPQVSTLVAKISHLPGVGTNSGKCFFLSTSPNWKDKSP